MGTITNPVRLYTDRNATGEVAEWQEKARQQLDAAEVKYLEQFVTNDWRDGTFTPMLQTPKAVYAGLDLIEQYAASMKQNRHRDRKTQLVRRRSPQRRF